LVAPPPTRRLEELAALDLDPPLEELAALGLVRGGAIDLDPPLEEH